MITALTKKKIRTWKRPLWDKVNKFAVCTLILLALFVGAILITWLREENLEAKNSYPFARDEIRRMRTER